MTPPSDTRARKFCKGEIVVMRPSTPVKIIHAQLRADGPNDVWWYTADYYPNHPTTRWYPESRFRKQTKIERGGR